MDNQSDDVKQARDRLTKILKESGLTLKETARVLDISARSASFISSGWKEAGEYQAERIGILYNHLFTEDGEPRGVVPDTTALKKLLPQPQQLQYAVPLHLR